MKVVAQEVVVEVQEGRPQRLTWGQRSLTVTRVLDAWRYGGRWWLGEAPRDCFLLELGALTAELHHEALQNEEGQHENFPAGRWWLARVQD